MQIYHCVLPKYSISILFASLNYISLFLSPTVLLQVKYGDDILQRYHSHQQLLVVSSISATAKGSIAFDRSGQKNSDLRHSYVIPNEAWLWANIANTELYIIKGRVKQVGIFYEQKTQSEERDKYT